MSDLGYPFLLSHEVAATGRISRSTLRFVVKQRLWVGLLAATLGSGAYLLVAEGHDVTVVLLFSVSLLSTVVYSSLSAALRGLHVFRVEASNEIVSRAFVLVAGWSLLAAGGGLIAAVGVYAAADLGSLVVLGFVAGQHVADGDDGIDRDHLRMRHNAHLTAGRGLTTLYTRADTWLVALLDGTRGAALYGAPYRLLDGFLLIPRSIGAVAVPHLARRDDDRRSIGTIAAVSAGLAAVFAIPVAVFSEPILVSLFGQRYSGSASTLALLAVSAIPGAVVMAALPLLGLRRPRPVVWLMAGALALNVGLNLIAIPAFGPVGAAGVNLTTQAVLALALLVLLRATSAVAEDAPDEPQVMASIRSNATRDHSVVSSSTVI
jgi:O-antigen/teichoic acid export membrane protein